jgi:hypothetical protein
MFGPRFAAAASARAAFEQKNLLASMERLSSCQSFAIPAKARRKTDEIKGR